MFLKKMGEEGQDGVFLFVFDRSRIVLHVIPRLAAIEM
jgi:hypothetical protein